jgi:hypothetical protein
VTQWSIVGEVAQQQGNAHDAESVAVAKSMSKHRF